MLGGDLAPDPALLAHAHDIVGDLDGFYERLRKFLQAETTSDSQLRYYRDEIEGLTLGEVCLGWPDRPNDGMLFFSGGFDYRAWRCDYIQREFQWLGFDS